MRSAKPADMIELLIFTHGRWRPFESFDPSSPQFASSAAPAKYAWFEAHRQGARLVKTEPAIERYRVQRAGRCMERSGRR